MRLTVRVKTKSKQPSVAVEGKTAMVAVHETPTDGRANAAVIKALAKHFHVAPSCIRILRGATSRIKIVEVVERT